MLCLFPTLMHHLRGNSGENYIFIRVLYSVHVSLNYNLNLLQKLEHRPELVQVLILMKNIEIQFVKQEIPARTK